MQRGLRFHVDLRRRLVENDDGRVLENGAGDRQPLRLPRAQGHALVADHRVQAVGTGLHEVQQLGAPERPEELIVRRFFPGDPQVLPNGPEEQERVLGNESYQPANLLQRQVLFPDAAEQDFA